MRIIITGASRGIGRETAIALSENKAHTILAIARDEDKLKLLANKAAHGNILILPMDISQIKTDDLLETVTVMGGVDVLVNNAGLLINKPFEALSLDDWQKTFDVNLFAVVRLIGLLEPFLKKSKDAHIVNIGSMGGYQGASKFPGLAAYSTSKAAIASLTECLAQEFSEAKIAVNCLAFGAVQTEMLEQAFPGYKAPLSADEMAEFLSWFATKGQHFFNGKILPVSLSTP